MSFLNTHLASSTQTLVTNSEFPAEGAGMAGSGKTVLLVWITGWERYGSQAGKSLCAGLWIWTCPSRRRELLSILRSMLYSLCKTTTTPDPTAAGGPDASGEQAPWSPTRVAWGVRMQSRVEETWEDNWGPNTQNVAVWSTWGERREAKIAMRFRAQKPDKMLTPWTYKGTQEKFERKKKQSMFSFKFYQVDEIHNLGPYLTRKLPLEMSA